MKGLVSVDWLCPEGTGVNPAGLGLQHTLTQWQGCCGVPGGLLGWLCGEAPVMGHRGRCLSFGCGVWLGDVWRSSQPCFRVLEPSKRSIVVGLLGLVANRSAYQLLWICAV